MDIVGPSGPKPWAPARVKMMWDEDALYIGAALEDTALFANQTLHDSIIYHDNNWEVWCWRTRFACHPRSRQCTGMCVGWEEGSKQARSKQAKCALYLSTPDVHRP